MFLLVLRTLVVYVLIVAAMRLMGKKQLGELQPSELVSTILISNLASLSIESPDVPLVTSMLTVFLIVACEILVSALCVRFRRAQRLVSGRPRIVVREGVIDQKRLKELRFTPDDLLEALRAKDIFELSDVALAVVETNGSVSVQRTFAADSAANGSLGLKPPKAKLPSLPVLIDGDWADDSLAALGLTREWVLHTCARYTRRWAMCLFCCATTRGNTACNQKAKAERGRLICAAPLPPCLFLYLPLGSAHTAKSILPA